MENALIKYWIILALFLSGLGLTIIGSLFKIQHWAGASAILTISMAMQVIAIILLIIKLIAQRNTNGLNK